MSAAQKKGTERQFVTEADERAAAHDFIELMLAMVPREARLILCQFHGDPNETDQLTAWKPKVWNSYLIQENWNVYATISAFGEADRKGDFRRKKECWEGGLAFMVDDLGTKLPLDLIDHLEPTALIETSPENYQALYVFPELVTRQEEHEAVISNFVEKFCAAEGKKDPGMKGVTRVFRPPFGVNMKEAYRDADGKPWRVRLASFNPAARYTPAEIAEAFGYDLTPPQRNFRSTRKVGDRDARIAYFRRLTKLLLDAGVFKNPNRPFNRGGWAQVTCPWIDGHTKRADTGAAIRWPDPDNDYHGAFRCHHGSCEFRTWSDFTNAISDQITEGLEGANASAPDSLEDFQR